MTLKGSPLQGAHMPLCSGRLGGRVPPGLTEGGLGLALYVSPGHDFKRLTVARGSHAPLQWEARGASALWSNGGRLEWSLVCESWE
jgi:hypothetical protein